MLMEKIFDSYTGNAMLNNALMTIEALGNLKNVSEITPDILLLLYNNKELLKLNKRLKSYTMLFTKNGPLHNDKANGDKTYEALFKTIISSFENEGDKICEISGLKFNSTFSTVFKKTSKSIGISEKEIQKKDTNLSRSWFPLIGGLGSDAQSLPQAKFTIQIHPICIAILQFLPLSSLIYNGGVLLIDSSNFDFARNFVADNHRELEKQIQATPSTKPIENVKYAKGHYLLKALKLLKRKEDFEETYSDLNLWSFSNSGTGASCEIDRVPNSLIQKLNHLNERPDTRQELNSILNNKDKDFSSDFLSALEDSKEWSLLYPNVFKKGKKKVVYEGVTVAFLEAYFEQTDNTKQLNYAKYIAYLIDKYKSKGFAKYLTDTSAWNEKSYRIDLYSVLVEATKNEEWNLNHQFEILDDDSQIPPKNNSYNLYRLIHYYYQKKASNTQTPALSQQASNARIVVEWIIALIQNDENKTRLIKDLTNTQDYISVGYAGLLLRSYDIGDLDLKTIRHFLYNENFLIVKNGLNELLRIFFSQPKQELKEIDSLQSSNNLLLNNPTEKWFANFMSFSGNYQSYYFDKYENKETGRQPYGKFLKLIQDISLETTDFLYWFNEATERTNNFLNTKNETDKDKWSDALLYNPNGEYAISFAKFAIKFSLLKQYQSSFSQQNQIIIS